MEFDDQSLKLGHLLLNDRKCRICGVEKNLIEGFYRSRKGRGATASSYSYECKVCTIKRIVETRKSKIKFIPDMVSTRKMTEILVQFDLTFQLFSYFVMALSF